MFCYVGSDDDMYCAGRLYETVYGTDCALQDDGDVFCAGSGFGNSPTLVQSSVERFYINSFGDVVADDADVWRVSPVRASCELRGSGLVCGGQSYGPPGDIVDGGNVGDAVCWLTKDKNVSCTGNNKNDYFEEGRVLALATGAQYSTSMCAVYDDGSLWCIGDNDEGMLGTGNTLPVNVETMVAGPGAVRIGCP